MSYKITNISKGRVTVGDLSWEINEAKTLSQINADIIKAVEVDKTLSSDTDLTLLGGLSAITNGMSDLTDSSGGTAATITDGEATVAVVGDVAAAADAIATLIVEQGSAKTAISALITRLALVESAVKRLESSTGGIVQAK